MLEVSKEEFYRTLYADPRDIMPRIVDNWSDVDGYIQEWRSNDSRHTLFGITKGSRVQTYTLVNAPSPRPTE